MQTHESNEHKLFTDASSHWWLSERNGRGGGFFHSKGGKEEGRQERTQANRIFSYPLVTVK